LDLKNAFRSARRRLKCLITPPSALKGIRHGDAAAAVALAHALQHAAVTHLPLLHPSPLLRLRRLVVGGFGDVGFFDGDVGFVDFFDGDVGFFDGDVGFFDGDVGFFDGDVGFVDFFDGDVDFVGFFDGDVDFFDGDVDFVGFFDGFVGFVGFFGGDGDFVGFFDVADVLLFSLQRTHAFDF
jgi:hypothetical protein